MINFMYILLQFKNGAEIFIAVLLRIDQHWEQPTCPSVGEWLKKLVHPYNGILLSNQKEKATNTCTNSDGFQGHHRPKLHDSAYITCSK